MLNIICKALNENVHIYFLSAAASKTLKNAAQRRIERYALWRE